MYIIILLNSLLNSAFISIFLKSLFYFCLDSALRTPHSALRTPRSSFLEQPENGAFTMEDSIMLSRRLHNKTNNTLSGKPLDCKIFTITVKFKVCGRRRWFIRNPVGQWTRKAKAQVIGSPFQSSWKPRSIPCSSSVFQRNKSHVSLPTKRRSSLEIKRSLWTAKHSVSASTIKYSASWLSINGICWRACWKCFSRLA